MKFIDNKHKEFWNKKYKEIQALGKTDVYYKSIVYTLGICETTRDNFDNIFNLKTGEINVSDRTKSVLKTSMLILYNIDIAQRLISAFTFNFLICTLKI